jgi:hypothetical protein
MDKTIGKKPKDKEESLINWSVLSQLLTGNKQNIRQNRVPSKHKEQVERLLYYFECWEKGIILISPDDFRDKIKNLDLITIILDKK